jgi:hypothetical protein
MSQDSFESRTRGQVVRVVDDSLAYVLLDGGSSTLSFGPDALANYRGESFQERHIEEGARVEIEWDRSAGLVKSVSVPRRTRSASRESLPAAERMSGTRTMAGEAQLELHPQADARGEMRAFRALSRSTRTFGKLIDTSALAAGDLFLTRELAPDGISNLITEVQSQGGYGHLDSRWTHAAMYVGDGEHLVEATFDSLTAGGSVRLTRLDEYCEGTHVLRVRRSKFLTNERDGWRVCVRAMSRLRTGYSFKLAVSLWFQVVVKGRSFNDETRRMQISQAVVCSTLYADAYNEATRRSLGEVSGICVPAWLSISDEFDDVRTEWLTII